jgi:hypothetical protein
MNFAGVSELRLAIQSMANYSMVSSTHSDPVIDVGTKQDYDFTVKSFS